MQKKRSVLIGRTNRQTDKMAKNLLGTTQERKIQLKWVKPILLKIFSYSCVTEMIVSPLSNPDISKVTTSMFISQAWAICDISDWTILGDRLGGSPVCLVMSMISSVIFSPLLPASLTHTNPQRRKIIYDMRPVGRKDRSIDRSIWTCVLVEIFSLVWFLWQLLFNYAYFF